MASILINQYFDNGAQIGVGRTPVGALPGGILGWIFTAPCAYYNHATWVDLIASGFKPNTTYYWKVFIEYIGDTHIIGLHTFGEGAVRTPPSGKWCARFLNQAAPITTVTTPAGGTPLSIMVREAPIPPGNFSQDFSYQFQSEAVPPPDLNTVCPPWPVECA